MVKKIKRGVSAILSLVICISSNILIPVQAKSEPIKRTLTNGAYVIESAVGQGKVLDISELSKESGANTIIWDYNGGLNQAFYFDYDPSDGYYSIVAIHSCKYLGVEKTNDDKGTEVKQYNASFKDNFKWKVLDIGSGQYQFELKSSGLKLDVCGCNSKSGTHLQLWPTNDTNAQKFRMHKVSLSPTEAESEIHSLVQRSRDMVSWERVKIDPKINKITKEMFSPCENLKFIEIPLSVEEIEQGTFDHCEDINTVICDPKWLQKFNKSKLKNVIIADGVQKIQKDDFKGCKNLDFLKIPESVVSIQDDSFLDCQNITSFDGDPKWLQKFNKLKLKNVIIPEWVKNITADAFKGCYDLHIECSEKFRKEMNESINKIMKKAFSDNDFTQLLKTENDLKNSIDNSNEFIKTFKKVDRYRYIKNYLEGQINGTKLSKTQEKQKEGITLRELNDELVLLEQDIKQLIKKYISLKTEKKIESKLKTTWKNNGIIFDKEKNLLIANVSGDTLDLHYKFSFVKEGESKEYLLNPEDDNAICEFNPKQTGKYKITLRVYDNDGNEQKESIICEIKAINERDVVKSEDVKGTEYTTIEDLVKIDGANARYAKYGQAVLDNIDLPNFSYSDKSDTSLENISMKVSNVCREFKKKFGIKTYPVQVMTVLRLVDDILNDNGSIAQVQTGEGKSFIIAILGTVLAQFGRTVDVVTSTSELARRDYENQKKYYDLFGISSGVLKRNNKDNDSLRSEIKEEFNLDSLNKQIVYSTNSTFEFLFLQGVFANKALRNRPYDVVIVDEIDNMLLDQGMTPAIIANPMQINNAEEIFKTVYKNREKSLGEIIESVKHLISGDENSINTILKLQEAAKISDKYEEGKDYVVQNGEIMIIDHTTGYIKPGSRWKNFIHEMVEIKHEIRMKPSSVSISLVTQNSFFNMYKRITGLTGTLGSKSDRELLTKTYNTKLFYIPRHVPSKQKIEYHQVSDSSDKILVQIVKEIKEMQKQNRPVLAIMPTNNLVDYFCENFFPEAKKITGVDLEGDRQAIATAGNAGQITIATNAAGRGIDIILDEKAKASGGLHVIIPFLPINQRVLSQAMGRSARQGQPGSVSIYTNAESRFYNTPEFNGCYDKLIEIQMRFAEYMKKQWPWMFDHEPKYNLINPSYPLGVTPEIALQYMSQEMVGVIPTLKMYCNDARIEEALKDSMRGMIMHAWGIFFSDLSDEADNFVDPESLEVEYQDFIEELHNYFPKDCKTFEEVLSNFMATAQLSMIEELSGKIMQCVGLIMDSAIPEPIKEILQNKVVSGTMNIATGVGQILAGAEMCATVVGTIGGIPTIVNGSNMAIMGIQDIWNVIHGKDEESVNLIKEALGHKYDNTVDLMELAITMGSAKKVSKVGQKAMSEAKNSLGEAFGKARKYTSAIGNEARAIAKSARKLCRKQIAKLRGPKRALKGIPVNAEEIAEEFTKENQILNRGLKPNIQLFAENTDAVNKAPYNPRKVEDLLNKDGAEVTSNTLPRYNQPNVKLAGKSIERTVVKNAATGESAVQRIVFDQKGFPIFDPYVKVEVRISGDLNTMDRAAHMRAATRQLRADIESGMINKSLFTDSELSDIMKGKSKIGDYTWHHHQDTGRMQLVPTSIHKWVKHVGGFDLWGKK